MEAKSRCAELELTDNNLPSIMWRQIKGVSGQVVATTVFQDVTLRIHSGAKIENFRHLRQ